MSVAHAANVSTRRVFRAAGLGRSGGEPQKEIALTAARRTAQPFEQAARLVVRARDAQRRLALARQSDACLNLPSKRAARTASTATSQGRGRQSTDLREAQCQLP